MPKGFNYHSKSAGEVVSLLLNFNVELISLDHDLGEEKFIWSDIFGQYKPVGTGYDVAKAIEEAAFKGKLKRIRWRIHSANPVGCENMKRALESAEKYWDKGSDNAIDSES